MGLGKETGAAAKQTECAEETLTKRVDWTTETKRLPGTPQYCKLLEAQGLRYPFISEARLCDPDRLREI